MHECLQIVGRQPLRNGMCRHVYVHILLLLLFIELLVVLARCWMTVRWYRHESALHNILVGSP